MERRAWLGVAIVLLCVGSACTANGPLVRASVSPSPPTFAPSQAASPSPQAPTPSAAPLPVTPSIYCSTIPSADSEPLVMALTSDRQQVLLDSFRDPTHPTTLCTMSNSLNVKFVSRTEIGYTTTASTYDPNFGFSLITRMSLTDLKPVPLVRAEGQVMDVAWSPDGSSVAYLMYLDAPSLGSGNANQLWLKTGNAPPLALTPPIPLFGRGGSVDDQIFVGFSHDGKYLLMVDTLIAGAAPASPDQAVIQVRSVPDGSLVFVPPSALGPSGNKFVSFITMAAWSRKGDRLYYRDQAGVHTWDPPGTVGTLAAGLTWYSPSISPDGRFVAYALNVGEQPHVEVRDLVSNTVQVLPGIRGAPFFVADRMVFEAEYAPTQQGPGPPYIQTGRDFVFDLRTNVETPIPVVINPIDSWPR